MKNKIPHYLIESFLMAASEASFQVAADKLGITQSTLSKQMILFEELLPHEVFTFDGRKKVLTSYGLSLLEALKPKFAQTQEIIEQTSLLFATPENLEIRICGRGEFLDLLALCLKFPGKINFMPVSNQTALELVLERKADIAIVHSAIDSSEIVLKPLLVNNFKLAIPKSFIKSKPANEFEVIKKLLPFPCLLYKSQDPVVGHLANLWDFKMEELKISRIYPNYSALSRMVDEGFGWCILPSHIQVNEGSCHVIPLSIKSQLNRKFYLCYRKDLSTASWLKDLVTEIKSSSIN